MIPVPMDYTTISLVDVRAELDAIAADAGAAFGRLDARQINWKADASSWSVAQCLEHLLTANRQMVEMADQALDATRGRTLWQRLPIWPGLLGRMLVRTQSPNATRRFKAPGKAQPAASALDTAIVGRFVDQRDCCVVHGDGDHSGTGGGASRGFRRSNSASSRSASAAWPVRR